MSPDTFTTIAAIACVGALVVLWALAYIWPDNPDDPDRDIDNTPAGVLDRRPDNH